MSHVPGCVREARVHARVLRVGIEELLASYCAGCLVVPWEWHKWSIVPVVRVAPVEVLVWSPWLCFSGLLKAKFFGEC